jgi:uncharacterized protein YjbI with pentapeptide repeats
MSWSIYVFVGLLVFAVAFVGLAYRLGWGWTGFAEGRKHERDRRVRPGKTLWDWLELLLVPFALAAAAFVLNELQSKREHQREDRQARVVRSRAVENRRDEVLRGYVQQMSQLILDGQLNKSAKQSEVRVLARTLTLTALRRLDGERKGIVIRFLAEGRLIDVSDPKVILHSADLRRVVLEGAVLRDTDLSETNLKDANFHRARLDGTMFSDADMRGANFRAAAAPDRNVFFDNADLAGTHFNRVFFPSADFTDANLRHANFRGAWLSEDVFTGACLTRASFRKALLKSVRLGALGDHVEFSGAAVLGSHGRRGGTVLHRSGWREADGAWKRESDGHGCSPEKSRGGPVNFHIDPRTGAAAAAWGSP